MSYSFYEILWIFTLYSFIGWCAEVVYAASVNGKFINRGFNTGPVCPIYGFGILSVLLFLEGIKDYWFLLFISSVIFTSMLEFLVGFILERFFHEKWWDYSDQPFNIKGYICLRFSIMWGFACVFVINLVHPTIMRLIHFIPQRLGEILLIVIITTFLADTTITVINILKIQKSLRAILEIESALENLSVSIGTNLSDGTLAMMDKREKLKEKREENTEKLKTALSEKMYDKEDIKEAINDKREELEELRNKLKSYISSLEKPSRHIRSAFPNISKGRYKNIFKK